MHIEFCFIGTAGGSKSDGGESNSSSHTMANSTETYLLNIVLICITVFLQAKQYCPSWYTPSALYLIDLNLAFLIMPRHQEHLNIQVLRIQKVVFDWGNASHGYLLTMKQLKCAVDSPRTTNREICDDNCLLVPLACDKLKLK
jgi:hypothetical protein